MGINPPFVSGKSFSVGRIKAALIFEIFASLVVFCTVPEAGIQYFCSNIASNIYSFLLPLNSVVYLKTLSEQNHPTMQRDSTDNVAQIADDGGTVLKVIEPF